MFDMRTLVASFATALLLGGSTLVYAQQPQDQGRGGPSAPARGAESAAEKGAAGGEQRAQEQQPDRARETHDRQQDRTQQPAQDNQDRGKQAQDKKQQDRTQQRAQDNQDRGKQAQDKQPTAGGPTQSGGQRAEPVQLSDEQRNRVRDDFRRARTNVRHYTNVNVNITVGQRLPRDWTYRKVPQYVVDVAPRFRGHHFVWVENRYCIVDPATYAIVAFVDDDSGVIHTSSGQVAGWTGRDGRDLSNARCEANWSDAERRRIIEEVEVHRTDRLRDVRVGINLPGDIELKVFPSRLRTQFRPLDECRYVPINDDAIAVIEPDTRKVVGIIERR